MSYGMHNYLYNRAVNNYGYMRKLAAADPPEGEGGGLYEDENYAPSHEEMAEYTKDVGKPTPFRKAPNPLMHKLLMNNPVYRYQSQLVDRTAATGNELRRVIKGEPVAGTKIPYDKRSWLEKGYSRVRDWVVNNPKLAMDLGGVAGGVTIGSLISPKNRLRNAAVGGGLGLLATILGRSLYNEYTS